MALASRGGCGDTCRGLAWAAAGRHSQDPVWRPQTAEAVLAVGAGPVGTWSLHKRPSGRECSGEAWKAA